MKNLYVHIPFCVKKCDYCDFVSFGGYDDDSKQAYVNALVLEIASLPVSNFETIFFGGGTPSVLTIPQIQSILNAIQKRHTIDKNCEITLEANPETINREIASSLFSMGFNRISMGLQSSDDNVLKAIGRIHTYDKFLSAYDGIVTAGFSNINIDIMYGLPLQTKEIFKNTLKNIIDLCPSHVSAYELILNEDCLLNSKFNRGEIALPNEDEVSEMSDCLDILETHFPRYEISNYAKKEFHCRHNINYWQNGSYFGVGCGAHGCVDPQTAMIIGLSHYENVIRYENSTNINEYISKSKPKYTVISKFESMFETVMLGLRMVLGIDEHEFYNRYGDEIYPILKNYIEKNPTLIKRNNGKIFLTRKGMDIQNTVLIEVLDLF